MGHRAFLRVRWCCALSVWEREGDECPQPHRGRDALFESQSQAAEMTFATLKPPEPSLMRLRTANLQNIPLHAAYQ
eukprot:4635021-Prymnesium_polylepis.1